MGDFEPHPVPANGASRGRWVSHRGGLKAWCVLVASVASSAAAVAAVGLLCAIVYPVLKELRVETVMGDDGTERRMLGVWAVLVLSVLAGCLCSFLSWTLTYLNSYRPGADAPALLTLSHLRDDLRMDYGVAALNGVMATIAVIWSLS